jgi:hypothetical protein
MSMPHVCRCGICGTELSWPAPHVYEVISLHGDGTQEILNLIDVSLKLATRTENIIQIRVAPPMAQSKPGADHEGA